MVRYLAFSTIVLFATTPCHLNAQTAWETKDEKSEVDGSRTVYASKDANQTIPTRFGAKVTPSLILACHRGESRAYINWGTTVGGLYGQTIVYRIDDEKPRSIWWSVSSNYGALGYWGQEAISFSRQLIGAQKIFVRARLYSGSDAEISVDLDGLEDTLKPIADACKWPNPKLGLSDGEKLAVMRQIAPCWNLDADAKFPSGLAVDLRLTMHRNGTVRDARLVHEARMEESAFRVLAESALRAVVDPKCNPINLPIDQYFRWRTIELRFDPAAKQKLRAPPAKKT